MKYIFLDIDGVLNCNEGRLAYEKDPNNKEKYKVIYYDGFPYEFLEVELLRKLHEIVYKTNAVIVGVSSWFGFEGTKYEKQMMKKIPKTLSLPIYDISDNYSGGKSRGNGVISWLNKKSYNPEKDSFIILDDSAEFYDFEIRRVNSKTGLSNEDVINAIKVLNSKGISII